MRIIYALFFLMVLILPLHLRGQQTVISDKNQKGNKTLISVPVSVSDREGRYIPGLKKADFTLYQNGVEQNIALFETYDEPLNIALLLDTSGSAKESLSQIKAAAADFIELLNPNDRCLVATFDSQLNILNPLTSNQKTLVESLGKVRAAEKEGTILFSAVEQIAQKSFADVQGRKVIVLLSDGKDFGSSRTRGELLSLLEESDVLIYSIFYQTGAGFNKLVVAPDGTIKEGKEDKKPKEKKPRRQKKNYSILIPLRGDVYSAEEIKLSGKVNDVEAVNSLREMSDTTAGRFYQSDTPNLSGVFKRIAGELRQQYRLGYYSKEAGTDAALYDINVKVRRPDAVVRARGKFRAKQLSGQ
ncbi:MAG: VWA domain-containing protein [Pyrinomonadaceae bacterium]